MTPEQLDELGFQLSHDLKSYLRNIHLDLDRALIANQSKNFELADTIIKRASEQSAKLIRLIDGITGLSYAALADDGELVSMTQLAQSAASSLEPLLRAENITVSISDLKDAHTDSSLLQEVISQLIKNSIESYQRQPTESIDRVIEIGVTMKDGHRVYFVGDNGPGVDESQQAGLFSAHASLEKVGLGLLFCRRVLDRLGGRIWHDPTHPQTRFCFTLAPEKQTP